MENSENKPLKKRNRGHNKRIGFSEEIVTKDAARTLLSKESTAESNGKDFLNEIASEEPISEEIKTKTKKTKKRKKEVCKDSEPTEDKVSEVEVEPKKKKRNQQVTNQNNEGDNSISKRSLKRSKYQKILEDKKIASLETSKNNALNYLSNWKYNKSQWKFEKLKQVWLTQNLYDSSKIDDKFWETLVEYFENSQGKVRQEILDKAIKIIEDEEIEANDKVKFKRARDIVQSLQ